MYWNGYDPQFVALLAGEPDEIEPQASRGAQVVALALGLGYVAVALLLAALS